MEQKRKIAVIFYKAKFEWRKVLGDVVRLKKPKVHLIDDGINLWTALCNIPLPGKGWFGEVKAWFKGSYSHVEIMISDVKGWFWENDEIPIKDGGGFVQRWTGLCYTSTMRGEMNGNCMRPASEVIKDPARWDGCIVKETSDKEFTFLMKHINYKVLNNQGYDKLCIADFFNLFRRWAQIHSKLKDICSEAVQAALFIIRIRLFSLRYAHSPRRIARILRKNGYKIVPVRDLKG